MIGLDYFISLFRIGRLRVAMEKGLFRKAKAHLGPFLFFPLVVLSCCKI
jgi:hypothetical protein